MFGGAYSNVVVAGTTTDPPSDHAFFQALVYTTLRHLPWIDQVIERHASRPIGRIERLVLSVLRVAVAELAMLDIEPHAAVNEAVTSAGSLGMARASGFVNAVLRSIATADEVVADAVTASFPEAIRTMVTASHGPPWAIEFLMASNEAAPIGVRFRDGSHLDAEIPGAAYIDGHIDPWLLDRREASLDGSPVDIMDPASTAVAVAVSARQRDLVADLAAAPGGKTLAVSDVVGPGGRVVAVDVHPRRLADAARRVSRVSGRQRGVGNVQWVVADAITPPFAHGTFDRVLLDAPCTGLGTLRRRPEIRYRVRHGAPERYGSLQRQLLEAALPLVRPGGRLVYSVCTVTRSETVAVVAGLGFRPPVGLPGREYGDGLLLSPNGTGTDGMFIAVADR
jgi:16S rRNA (cytosine967-C5)-methyltransferase